MSIEIFTTLSKEIQTLTKTFTTEVMQNVITNITPIVIIGLTLWFLVYGMLIINQTIQQPLQSFLLDCAKIGIITSIALTGGIYQDKIAYVIITLPDDFAKLAFNSSESTFSVADQMLTIGIEKSAQIFSSMSILEPADSIGKMLIAIIIGISTVLIGGIGGALLLLIQVSCTVLAAIGPLFIIALLFSQTRQLFSNWLGEIIGYSMFGLILTITFMFILKVSEKYLSNIQEDDNMLSSTLVFLVLLIVSGFLFFEAKNIAQRLSGVFSMSLAGRASDVASTISGRAAKQGAKSVSASAAKGASYVANKAIAGAKSWRKNR